MTIEEFLVELAKYTEETKEKWRIEYWAGFQIRCGDGFECPISFVATYKTGTKYTSSEIWDAADEIKLNRQQAYRIVQAADGRGAYSSYIRDSLLKATQLG